MRTDAKRRKEGLTLVELMVVVMVMAILGLVVLGIGSYASRKAAESRAIADLQNIRNALEEYRIQHGRYLGTIASAGQDLTDVSNHQRLTNYVADLRFEDPWGHPYRYHLQGRYAYRVWSTGPSGPAGDYDYIE